MYHPPGTVHAYRRKKRCICFNVSSLPCRPVYLRHATQSFSIHPLPPAANFLSIRFTEVPAKAVQTTLHSSLPVKLPYLNTFLNTFRGEDIHFPSVPYSEIAHGIPEKAHGIPVEKMSFGIIPFIQTF
jgi:hypothetical protein